MTSQVSISNRALTFLGSNRITSLSEDSLEAKTISSMYEQSLRSILSECRWTFATERVLLTGIAESPAWQNDGMTNYFQLPSDVIRIFETKDPKAIWRVEGERVLANVSTFGILYVKYLDEPSKYSSQFTEAFARKLAADCAYEITNSASLAQQHLEIYRGQDLEDAMAENSQIGTAEFIIDDQWTNAKYSFVDGNRGFIGG
jgi:hypothetical protein